MLRVRPMRFGFLLALPLFPLGAKAQLALPHSLFSIQAEPPEGFASSSELSLNLVTGNSQSKSAGFRHESSYRWPVETVQAQLLFNHASANEITTTENWAVGLRYERRLIPWLGGYAGEALEGNVYQGFRQRYSTDLGLRKTLWEAEGSKGAAEVGYRYRVDNPNAGAHFTSHIVRLYVESSYAWSPKASSLASIEYLPNVQSAADWMLNAQIAIQAELRKPISLKTSYTIKYDNRPASPGLKKTDTMLTTSLVAKF